MPLKNVFQIWMDLGRKVPFAVRNEYHNWSPDSYYIVKKVEISAKNWEYFERKGSLYGKARGDLYRWGKLAGRDVSVSLAGTYEWVLVEGKT